MEARPGETSWAQRAAIALRASGRRLAVRLRSQSVLIAAVTLGLGALIGGVAGRVPLPSAPSNEMADNPAVRDFARAMQLIEEAYATTPDKERLTRSAVQAMLHQLDPHSNFFNRRDFAEMQDEQSSRFYGIGVTINLRNGRIYVLGVSPGTPAERAGLRYGDAITAVDGRPTVGWTQSDALQYVRGERSTEVAITVERAGQPEPLTVKITRDEVPFPSVRNSFLLRPGVGYIALTGGFNENTTEELHEAINRLHQAGMSSLVLDLRRNPGGLLRQAVQVAETFLPRELEIVAVKARAGRGRDQVYRSSNAEPEQLPLAVLIDGDTASASEIVAAALQDHRRAVLIGEESFGKGLVQTVYPLRAGTGLTLTTAKYYTPDGRSIQRPYTGLSFHDYFSARPEEEPPPSTQRNRTAITAPIRRPAGGIKPDILVKPAKEEIRLRDACFEFARQWLATQPHSATSDTPPQARAENSSSDLSFNPNDFSVNEQTLAAFRAFWQRRPELGLSEARFHQKLDYIARRIRAELITAALGIDAADQFLLNSDPQVVRAVQRLVAGSR